VTGHADALGEPPGLDAAALRSPPFTAADAVELAAPWFGTVRQAVELGSHQDRNFLVTAADGRCGVLKIANPAFGRPALELANAAMRHVAGAGLPFATPRVIPAADGRLIVPDVAPGPEVRRPGRLVRRRGAAGPPRRVAAFDRCGSGRVAAEVATALVGFSHPAAGRAFQWSPDWPRT
jgi:Ser/Thr protein kinase RdoA (MazF antagonist)